MSNYLKNNWLTYVDRSYEQIKSKVLTTLQSKAPEITDHSETNPFVRIISVFAGIAEMLGYYIDKWAQERYITTASLFESAVQFANAYDYRVQSYQAASVEVTFILSEVYGLDVTIPANTEVSTADGISYFTTSACVIAAGDLENTVSAIQKVYVSGEILGLSDESADQKFIIDDTVVNNSVAAFWDADVYELQSTLGFSTSTDQHFIMSVDTDSSIYVQFGDGVFGAIPAAGEELSVNYYRTEGEAGNVLTGEIDTIVSSLSPPVGITITCTNRAAATGGTGIETVDELKTRVPYSLRTLRTAVTEQDFKDLALQAPSVIKADLSFTCGQPVQLYVVPAGGGIGSGAFLTGVETFFADKTLLGISVEANEVGELSVLLNMNVVAIRHYTNTDVRNSVIAALTDYYSWETLGIKAVVKPSDIFQIVEGVEGVNNSNIVSVVIKPYARVIEGANTLDWANTVTGNQDSPINWQIGMTSATTYELFRDMQFVGNFTVGTVHNFTDIQFIINDSGTYVIGDTWEFYTYPSPYPQNSLNELPEFSIPIMSAGNLTINVTGGL